MSHMSRGMLRILLFSNLALSRDDSLANEDGKDEIL
jgi:hypothetical protein